MMHNTYSTYNIILFFFLNKNEETQQEKVKLMLQHLLRINKYSLGQKDTAETKRNKTKDKNKKKTDVEKGVNICN